MTELKTQRNDASVEEFLNGVENDTRREDALEVLGMMRDVTGEEPEMWGKSIVGFGTYHYKYASGREADWMKIGFSPRKKQTTLYIMDGFKEYETLLKDLGKHSTGGSCLYINKLDDVDRDVLREIMTKSYELVSEASDETRGE